jgi:hypothetical protein
MARREVKAVRGVFERPKGSGLWWINFYQDGKQHREKVGARSAAIDLYRIRKADARRGVKLPDLRNGKVTLSALIDGALEFARTHNKSVRDYECKAKIVRADLGSRPAEDITPEELDRWISLHCKTPATSNRYRAFFSLCYREGQRNRKVDVNPARLVRPRRENNARLRFLSREEYDKLAAIIKRDDPEQFPSLVVSVYTGMRLTEQFTLSWAQVDSMTSMWPTHRQRLPRPSHVSEPCMESRSRSAESRQNFAAPSVRPVPGHCSMSCASGWTRRFARSQPRARPPAQSATRSHTGVR